MNLVAPSPSRTMACASCRATSCMASQQRLAIGRVERVDAGVAGLLRRDHHERIVGRGVAVDRDAVERRVGQLPCASGWISAGSIFASVAMKPSMVAMLGRIMPAPLLMPVTVTVRAADLHLALKALGTVSVVMMASAARAQLSARGVGDGGRQAGLDAVDRQRLHDHAGRKRQHLLRRDVQLARQRDAGGARARQAVLAGAGIGVAGVDHHRANRRSPAARCSRHTCTGAAQKRFCVNTPPTARAFVDQHHRQVLAVGLADAGFGDADAHARHRDAARPDRGRTDSRAWDRDSSVAKPRAHAQQLAVALLVLLAAAAGAGVVAADAREGRRTGDRPPVGGAAQAFFVDRLRLAGFGGRGVGDVGDALAAALHGLGGLRRAARCDWMRTVISWRVTSFLTESSSCAEQLEGLALVFLLRVASAHSRAGGCPGAGSRARRGARASACRCSAAAPCARTGVKFSWPISCDLGVEGVVGRGLTTFSTMSSSEMALAASTSCRSGRSMPHSLASAFSRPCRSHCSSTDFGRHVLARPGR